MLPGLLWITNLSVFDRFDSSAVNQINRMLTKTLGGLATPKFAFLGLILNGRTQVAQLDREICIWLVLLQMKG